MNYRNPRFNGVGSINCEIEHPVYGWIPFTASPDDTEEVGREVYAAALAEGPSEYVAPLPPANDEVIEVAKMRRQYAYTAEADPLFFKTQRGEATQQDWLDKIAEIKVRFPYPEE